MENTMSSELTLTPAYGRDYKSKATVLADCLTGKDFKIAGGPYTSIRDVIQFPGEQFRIRYDKLRKVLILKVKEPEQ